jgi:hypothetical protein
MIIFIKVINFIKVKRLVFIKFCFKSFYKTLYKIIKFRGQNDISESLGCEFSTELSFMIVEGLICHY